MSVINKINKLSQSDFVKVFANIFENAIWIAKELYKQKPFNSFEDLSLKMLDIFENTTKEKQLKILNAHPELADKTKIGSLTPDSQKEQSNAGLDQCSEDEFNEFRNLNDEYKKKFGFPFILAVKGRTKIEILNNFRQRVSSNANTEFNQTIKQVKQIASLRLKELNKKNI